MVKIVNCPACVAIEKAVKLFEDNDIVIILNDKPMIPGHCIILPKNHFAIIEQIPDSILGKMFNAANKISNVVFQALGAQGTNVIAPNGIPAGQTIPHFMIHVLPRSESDGLDLSWDPKPSSPEDLEDSMQKLSMGAVVSQEKKAPVEQKVEKKQVINDDEDYLIKQLRRIP